MNITDLQLTAELLRVFRLFIANKKDPRTYLRMVKANHETRHFEATDGLKGIAVAFPTGLTLNQSVLFDPVTLAIEDDPYKVSIYPECRFFYQFREGNQDVWISGNTMELVSKVFRCVGMPDKIGVFRNSDMERITVGYSRNMVMVFK